MSQEPLSPKSVVEFLHRFESVAAQEGFDLLAPMIAEQAFFRFNDGDFAARVKVVVASFMQPAVVYRLPSSAPR